MLKNLLVVLLGSVLLLGCSEQSRGRKHRETTSPSLEGTHWMLEALNGRPVDRTGGGRSAFLELHSKDVSFSGNTGLNAISGTYSRNSDHGLRFTTGPMTKIGGSDDAMTAEREFLHVLAETETYRIDGRELKLLVDDNVAALFVAQ